MKKIWRVKNKPSYTDEELIQAIKEGVVTSDDLLLNDMLEDYIKVNDSIYRFYLKGDNNETL